MKLGMCTLSISLRRQCFAIIWYINHQNFSLLQKSGFPRACHIIITHVSIHPRTQSTPSSGVSSSKLDKLSNRIDDLQAKCLYCGGKADSFIASLQTEIVKLEGLSPETENTILLSLAGLKQVRATV